MIARVATFTIDGVEPRPVWVEADIQSGLPTFTIVGLGDVAVRESRDRIRAAIVNSGYKFPSQRLTANLAPASLRKSGPGFDAAIALAVLAADGQLNTSALDDVAVFGELSLSGQLRDAPGALAAAEGARRAGISRLIVPVERAAESALVEDLTVLPVRGLAHAVKVLTGEAKAGGAGGRPTGADPDRSQEPDLADVRGQALPLLALEIAAAGGHNLLLEGPPGTGKTMLARRLSSILPPLSQSEALEVTRIHSIAGTHAGGLVQRRPFRAPHHSISAAGLVGGGAPPRPGEACLAHLGVLFLDELAEFQRPALEALRQPLEDGRVTIVRSQRAVVFPTRVMLVAATNPCPCGFAGVGDRCQCGEADLRRHERRLSGPLIDRMDMLVTVERPTAEELAAGPVTSSANVLERVQVARERQRSRLSSFTASCNGEMDGRSARASARLDVAAERILAGAYSAGVLSARGRLRVIRVARTIADLEDRGVVSADDLLLALSLRQRRSSEAIAA